MGELHLQEWIGTESGKSFPGGVSHLSSYTSKNFMWLRITELSQQLVGHTSLQSWGLVLHQHSLVLLMPDSPRRVASSPGPCSECSGIMFYSEVNCPSACVPSQRHHCFFIIAWSWSSHGDQSPRCHFGKPCSSPGTEVQNIFLVFLPMPGQFSAILITWS